MKIQRAAAFGVLGAIMMSVVMAFARRLGLPVHLELMLGTMTKLPPDMTAWWLGFGIHLGLGAIFGIVYGALFERLLMSAGAVEGIMISLPHAIVAGVGLAVLPVIHPLMPHELS